MMTGLEGVRLHDLRRTTASFMLSEGSSLATVGKALGHTQASTTARYATLAASVQRDPLSALLLQIQSLQSLLGKAFGEALDQRVAHKLQMAVRQAGQLNKLIDGLLDVTRITNWRMVRAYEELDLTGFARDVVERCRAQAERAGCALEFCGGEKIVGSWDPMQLEQVLTNLVGNAIKYGSSKPIQVAVEDAGAEAKIVVRDQGIGINQEDTKRIFERFERAVSPHHYGGLGLGLFIASRIVQTYGGTIAVASKQGEGSEFTVCLPRRCA